MKSLGYTWYPGKKPMPLSLADVTPVLELLGSLGIWLTALWGDVDVLTVRLWWDLLEWKGARILYNLCKLMLCWLSQTAYKMKQSSRSTALLLILKKLSALDDFTVSLVLTGDGVCRSLFSFYNYSNNVVLTAWYAEVSLLSVNAVLIDRDEIIEWFIIGSLCCVSLEWKTMLQWLPHCWVHLLHLQQITHQMFLTCLSTQMSRHIASVIKCRTAKWSAATMSM